MMAKTGKQEKTMSEIPAQPPEGLTRGHKKRARTHQALIEAAMRLYARKDIGSLTMNELAEEAGLANGTIYNYFRSKEEVLEAVGIHFATQLSDRILQLSASVENGAQRLVIGLRVYILRAYEEFEWAKAVVRVIQLDPGLRAILAAYVGNDLRIGKEQGLFDYADLDTAVDCVCSFGLAAVRAGVERRAAENHDVLVAEMVLRAVGVSPAKARHYASLPLPELKVAEAVVAPRRRGRPPKQPASV